MGLPIQQSFFPCLLPCKKKDIKLRGTINCVAVKAPGYGERRKAQIADIAALTGAQVISDELGIDLKEATIDMLGRCTTTSNNTFFYRSSCSS